MKANSAIAHFIGLLFCCMACLAQPQPAAQPATPPAEPAAAEPVAAEPVAAVPAAVEPAATEPDAANMASPDAVIPLIQFQEVALTTAIDNLARQAGLNYILDPRVPYGQIDETGKVGAQPNISIRWENLTAGQALNALLTVYSLQIVDDPKTKVSRITVKDPAAPDPLFTRILQLKYTSVTNLIAPVQAIFENPSRSKVIPDNRSSQLIIVATEKEFESIEELIERIDTPTKQVLIEAKILETTINPKTAKGIDWSGTLESQRFTFGNGLTSSRTTTTSPGSSGSTLPGGRPSSSGSSSQTITESILEPTSGGLSLNTANGFNPSTAFLNAEGVRGALSFLNQSTDTKTISEPRMVTLDNQKATIDVGLMFPIVNTSAGTANTAGGSQISYSNLTVNLDVTPRITADEIVELKVQQGILKLGPKFTSTVGDLANEVDSFFTRKLETTVLIPSGNTLVMGGLISDDTLTANKKVPILGDLPLVGLAFRHDSKERNRNNLIIFITPTIVQDDDFQPTTSNFLKTVPQKQDQTAWSGWDSGKPVDWSNPDGIPYDEAVFDDSAVRSAPAPSAQP